MDSAALPRRTQVERRNDSEEALLEAAAELVAERGVERASLASIGERAGTSRGLPTHHFGSKDVLVARLAARAQNRIDDAAWTALEGDARTPDELGGLDLICITVNSFLEQFEHPSAVERALIVMWGATFPREASVQGMIDADRRSFDGWAGLIEQGHRDGTIASTVDPPTAAVLLHGLVRGVAATILTHSDRAEMRRAREACLSWITSALAPRET